MMRWVTVFDIHQTPILPEIILTGFFAITATVTLIGTITVLRPPKDPSSKSVASFLSIVTAVFIIFTLSTVLDLRRTLAATRALDAGQMRTESDHISDVEHTPIDRMNKTSSAVLTTFKVGDRWFLCPIPRACTLQIGEPIEVAYLPHDGQRFTPLILRIRMTHPCAFQL